MTPKPLPLAFDALAGFADDDALAAFAAFRDWARAAAAEAPPLRAAKAPSPRLMQVARAACGATIADDGAARRFFVENFRPWRVLSDAADGAAFFTGYYEPVIDASLTPTPEFRAPVLARPRDLVSFAPGEGLAGPRSASSPALRSAKTGASLPTPTARRSRRKAARRSPGSPTRSKSSSPRCRARRG